LTLSMRLHRLHIFPVDLFLRFDILSHSFHPPEKYQERACRCPAAKMRGYIGNTDFDWYSYLKQQTNLDEVNFWQPSGGNAFHAIPPGAPFFFKLKKPYYVIAGFGLFAHHSVLPAWLAWDSFGGANGASNFDEMRRRIERYRGVGNRDPHGQYQIGCLLISQPIFFDERDWVEQPRDWPSNTVQGKTYDLILGEGCRIWEECRQRASAQKLSSYNLPSSEGELPRYGAPILVQPRLGQGTFRISVTDAYDRACAVTTEHALPVLEAAHIKPFSTGGLHRVSNGLLLRTDIHRLFDKGYVTVTPEYRFEASRRLKDDFDNGKTYYALHGKQIHVPSAASARPDPALLKWHNEKVFLS
jgi:putative restriction endonuclease